MNVNCQSPFSRISQFAVICTAFVIAASSRASPARSEQRQVTQHDVIPILLLRCTTCHGRQHLDGGLDLRSKASMLKGGESGPALVPGEPENSLILKRIHAEEMPPRRRLIEASVKPMEDGEIELLSAWIEAGAPEVNTESVPDQSEPPITEEDRQFWAFQPVGAYSVPQVNSADGAGNPIDAFILRKLEEHGLSVAPEADPRTLIRRAAFDLTGLPPELEDVERFLMDSSPGAYERMIDRLLSSRRYGERWGGYWLDRAGYADTEGERQQDILRPHAYRYRDYVIRAFNADKPYDRFLLEQLAGDELADYEKAEEITPEIHDNLVATGFLRMVPDPTWFNVTGFVPNRLDVVADVIDVLGSAVMGLTVKCARCHDHMFDPIPQQDYYSLAAIFKGAYDEHDWLKPNLNRSLENNTGRYSYRYLPHVPAEELQAWEVHDSTLKAEIASLQKALDDRTAPLKQKFFEERLAELPVVVQAEVRRAVKTTTGERDEIEKLLNERFEKTLFPTDEQLREFDEDFKQVAEELASQIESLEKKRRPTPMVRALWDRGEPSPTYFLHRGNYLTPRHVVQPATLSVLTSGEPIEFKPPWPGAKTTGRRLTLAKWLVQPAHPLTARVMVNTIWKHHFRRGIVKSLGNFGRTGTLPTHPELLDWMAREFVRRDWSVKAMHRLIMTSNTYRQLSNVTPVHETLDPDNDLLSRFPLKRMEAEVLWDTLLFISGRLDETPFGAADGVNVRPDGLVTAVRAARGWRRSIYVEHNRKQNMTILECFDLPRPTPNCLERKLSTVAPQALHLLNNQTIHELAMSFAERVIQETGDDPARQIDRGYQIALGRLPTPEEKQLVMESFEKLKREWREEETDPGVKALADICHVLINAAEFMYID